MLRHLARPGVVMGRVGRVSAISRRQFGTSPKEKAMEEQLKKAIDQVTHCEVTDVSGGCGSFFKVKVVSSAFQGKSLVDRNRMVYAALKDEISEMHGLNVECSTS